MWNKFKYYFKSLLYFIFLFLIYELFIHDPLLDNNLSSLADFVLGTNKVLYSNKDYYKIRKKSRASV